MTTTIDRPTRVCTRDGCGAPAHRRGLCRADYRAALTREKALAAADRTLGEDLAAYDRLRPRSRKTADARADGEFGVGPSDLKACPKAVEYRERPPSDYVPVPILKRAAHMGTAIDEGVKRARHRLYPWREHDRKVYLPGLDRPGELDEWDPILGRVVDFKSAGDWVWEKIGREGAVVEDVDQTMLYGLGLEEAGETVREVQVIYVHRDTGLDESFTFAYSRPRALAALSRLHAMVTALEEGRPLERTRLGPTVDPICARHCPAVRHCWGLDAVPADRTPEGFALVHDDADVERILVDYLAAHDQERPAKETKTYISKALLPGVEPGRYGDVVLGWTGGNLGEPKPDPQARVRQLEDALRLAREVGATPADPDTLPYPTRRDVSSVRISIKRVRAATLAAEKAAQAAAVPDAEGGAA